MTKSKTRGGNASLAHLAVWKSGWSDAISCLSGGLWFQSDTLEAFVGPSIALVGLLSRLSDCLLQLSDVRVSTSEWIARLSDRRMRMFCVNSLRSRRAASQVEAPVCEVGADVALSRSGVSTSGAPHRELEAIAFSPTRYHRGRQKVLLPAWQA